MNRIDIARKFEGLPSISEEFAQSEGINLYHKYIDENTGKEFLVDKNGKTIPLSKSRPKNFKVIQGGKN